MAVESESLAQQPSTGNDRRTEPRARTSLVATLSSPAGDERPVVVLDVSTGGALVETSEPLAISSNEALEFKVFGTEYRADIEVVRQVASDDGYLYGCRLLLPEQETHEFRQAVQAALGNAQTFVRPWSVVHEEIAAARPDQRVTVGYTPSGHPIELSPADCLEMGPEGVELFVQTVGGIELM